VDIVECRDRERGRADYWSIGPFSRLFLSSPVSRVNTQGERFLVSRTCGRSYPSQAPSTSRINVACYQHVPLVVSSPERVWVTGVSCFRSLGTSANLSKKHPESILLPFMVSHGPLLSGTSTLDPDMFFQSSECSTWCNEWAIVLFSRFSAHFSGFIP
jgi:hypothetical protein